MRWMKKLWQLSALISCLSGFLGISQPAAAQTTSAWIWTDGANSVDQPGIYGQLGSPATGNIPPGRWGAAKWTDNSGNLWLFGGSGYDAATNGTGVLLNDLWMFSLYSDEWTWMGGSGSTESLSPGVYGTLGTPAAGNIPGGRTGVVNWTDSSGNLWLFGGNGYDANGASGSLNDLWKFNSSSHEWAWMGGSSTVGPNAGRPGVYGTLGTPAAGNIPGGRTGAVSWTDGNGNLWLFGGSGYDADGNLTALNDVWKLMSSTNEWEWMGGSTTSTGCNTYKLGLIICGGAPGVYGTLGIPATENIPGGRAGSASWTDVGGNFWLFGGQGYDIEGNQGNLNDLWRFNPSSNDWTWMGGDTSEAGCGLLPEGNTFCKGQPGVYGTSGVSGSTNDPGARFGASSWTDTKDNFWLFGGYGSDSAGSTGVLNDQWEYQPGTTALPDFSIAASPESLTVTPGQSGTVAMTVIPLNGFSAPVSFTCSGLPSGASCSFSPASVTPQLTPVSTTLTVTASTATAMLVPDSNPVFPTTAVAVLLCSIGLKKRRLLQIVALLCVSGVGLGLFCGCGFHISSSTTANITVTATSGTLRHTTSFTLTVN